MAEAAGGAARDVLVALSTAPDTQTAERLARQLVEEHLAACVNLVPGIVSFYRWQGELLREGEVLLVIKTSRPQLERLAERLPELHPYEVPELLALPVEAGLDAYCRWVLEETRTGTLPAA